MNSIANLWGSPRPMTLLVFLAAAAMAQVIAPWRGDGAYGFNPWANCFPEFAQVVDGPDGFAESVDSGDAGARCAVFAQG